MLLFFHMSESMPRPTAETPKKPSRLNKLAKAAALAGALALPAQEAACVPLDDMRPLAANIGKTKEDLRERHNACQRGIQEAQGLKQHAKPAAYQLADQAERGFSYCSVSTKQGVWDEETFQKAQADLKQAKNTTY